MLDQQRLCSSISVKQGSLRPLDSTMMDRVRSSFSGLMGLF